MQCPSCQFENMPGSSRCARCGGLLALAAAAIDVHPPRASQLSRKIPGLWTRIWWLRRAWGNFQPSLMRPLRQLVSRFDDTDFRLGTILRTIIPGWAHSYRRNRPRAIVFFFGFLALFIPGVLFLGTSLGSILLGLAFAWHVAAASDALVGRFATIGDRFVFAIGCAAVLGFALYLPAGGCLSRVAVPIQINQTIPPFAAGEVLWYNPSANVEPGDYVLYQIPDTSLGGAMNGHNARYFFRNQWINRVVAVAGQRVRLKKRQLYVDGMLSPWQPRLGDWGDFEFDTTLPGDTVLIPPDALVPTGARMTESAWRRLSFVSRFSIDGPIFLRSHPLWRFSRITTIE
jgi:hypothetical protein